MYLLSDKYTICQINTCQSDLGCTNSLLQEGKTRTHTVANMQINRNVFQKACRHCCHKKTLQKLIFFVFVCNASHAVAIIYIYIPWVGRGNCCILLLNSINKRNMSIGYLKLRVNKRYWWYSRRQAKNEKLYWCCPTKTQFAYMRQPIRFVYFYEFKWFLEFKKAVFLHTDLSMI